MSKPVNPSPLPDPTGTVYGVASARIAGNQDDAHLLIQRYLEESRATGESLAAAWAELFSAAVIALTDEMTVSAARSHSTPQRVLVDRALKHARSGR